MSVTLDSLQTRLEAHFTVLAGSRLSKNLPVFALEHGLDANERAVLSTALNRSLGSGEKASRHWLVWIVYAAEQGYEYEGDEYWTTFEQRTPKWRQHGDRSLLRDWFKKFHKRFSGFKPTGSWARWFSIIAWPITHALLPKDLQYQLARTLYHARYSLADKLCDGPAVVGRFLASTQHESSSRFRNFLQQEEIVGRIVLALLGTESKTTEHFIEQATLHRITSDLQKINSAGVWLRDARKVVERARIKGMASASLTKSVEKKVDASPSQPFIRPSLILRRSGAQTWVPVVELPSLRPIADISIELGAFLRRSRCSVSGSVGMLPAGWLLQGEQRRTLTGWPVPNQPVVRFENSPPMLEQILRVDGCTTAGPVWLFKVGTDGLAHEVIGRVVRPGQQYVLVATGPLSSSIGVPATVGASGVSALSLDLPDQISDEMMEGLRELGLGVARTVYIAPAGLSARRWDGEGFAEWVEGETPSLVIRADHPIDSYSIQINGSSGLDVASEQNAPVFLKLEGLGVGSHTLSVLARPSDPKANTISGYLAISIRPPQPWIAGTIGHSGLLVTTAPVGASLDQLWEGDVTAQIFGPANHSVRICIELLDAGDAVLSSELVATLPLPISPADWSRAVAMFIKRDSTPWAYLTAASGRLLVDGGALGSWRTQLQRETVPLRWVWRSGAKGTDLRLVDDHEGDISPIAEFMAFATPANAIALSTSDLQSGFRPNGQGGLCIVRCGEMHDAVVVSMPLVTGGLSGLVAQPKLTGLQFGHKAIEQLKALLILWARAKLVGPLAAQRRQAVITTFRNEVLTRLFGREWAAAESHYAQSSKTEEDLRQLAAKTHAPSAFNFVLVRDFERYQSMNLRERAIAFEALVGRYGVIPPGAGAAALELCEWLANDGEWSDRIRICMDLVRGEEALVRAARFLTVAARLPRNGTLSGVAGA
jgi:hypothetical protein